MSTTAATAVETAKKEVVEGKNHVCCPPFDERKARFDEKEIQWTNKPFVKDSTWCFMYVPLNFGGAVKRAGAKIDAADAAVPDEEFILLSDMKSPWITNIYFSVTKDVVQNAEMIHLSGTFLTKVFEGPFKDFDKWCSEMKAYVKKEKGETFDVGACESYAYYPTCPKCSKKHGKNYVVLLVRVE